VVRSGVVPVNGDDGLGEARGGDFVAILAGCLEKSGKNLWREQEKSRSLFHAIVNLWIY
jgi:hypothetical protein